MINGTDIQTVFTADGSILVTQEGSGDVGVAASDYWEWDDDWPISASASLSPSASESPSVSPSISPSPSESPSESPSVSPSESPSVSPSESPSESPSVSPSAGESPSESPSVSPSYSVSPSASLSPSGVTEPDFVDDGDFIFVDDGDFVFADIISGSPSLSPSASESPSASPSLSPSASVSPSPSESPSESPSVSPSESPSVSPSYSVSPSESPSVSSSISPSISPSLSPSVSPSESPSISPSATPSVSESYSLSPSASASPSYSVSPSESPSVSPSASISPSLSQSQSPSVSPSVSPSYSVSPSGSVSPSASVSPSPSPTAAITDGTCRFWNAQAWTSYLKQAGVMTVGKYYKVSLTISNYVRGSISIHGSASDPYMDSDGDFSDIIYCDWESGDLIIYAAVDNTILDIDDISLVEVISAATANGTVAGDRYYWSTRLYPGAGEALFFDEEQLWIGEEALTFEDEPIAGINYLYKVIPDSFDGITIQSNLTESGQYNPTTLSFSVINQNNEYTADDFRGAVISLKLVASDRISASTISSWKFLVRQVNPMYEVLSVECDDFIANIMDSEYPNTSLVSDLFAPTESDKSDDPFCVPKTFGTAYIPLKSVEVTDYLRGYLLGDDDDSFTVNKITSPREFDSRQTWTVNDANFETVAHEDRTGNYDWNILFPFILKMDATNYSGLNLLADNNTCTDTSKTWGEDELVGLLAYNETDGSVGIITSNIATEFTCTLQGGTNNSWGIIDQYYIFSSGLWRDQSGYVNPLFEFSNDDTINVVSPESIAEEVLKDSGVSDTHIDSAATFDDAGTTFTDWGLELQGGFYYKRLVSEVLAEIMNSSHSVLDITDKVRWRVRSKTSQATITGSDIIENSFNYSLLTQVVNDSGNVAFAPEGSPHDILIKAVVPAKNMTENPSSDVLPLPMLHNSANAQRAGTLYFQRKFLREANLSFTGRSSLFGIQPDDVITIDDDDYGGEYDVLVNNIHIGKMLNLNFTCTKYKVDLDDWDDLTPDSITIATDGTTAFWQPVIAGPESATPSTGDPCHLVPGHLRIGSDTPYVYIDSTQPYISVVDSDLTNIVGFGNITNFAGYTSYGIYIGYGGDAIFSGSSYSTIFNNSSTGSAFYIDPSSQGNVDLLIGSSTHFGDIEVVGTGNVAIWSEADAVNSVSFSVEHDSEAYAVLTLEDGATTKTLTFEYDNGTFLGCYPSGGDEFALGTNTLNFAESFASTWNSTGDLFYMDKVLIDGVEVEIDDIEAINQIRPSGNYDPVTGLMLIDDSTLPNWLIAKHRRDGFDKDSRCNIIREVKRGDPMYDATGTKPWLSLTTLISLCMGGLRRSDKRIKILAKRLNDLEDHYPVPSSSESPSPSSSFSPSPSEE